jgi:hypothetical protein
MMEGFPGRAGETTRRVSLSSAGAHSRSVLEPLIIHSHTLEIDMYSSFSQGGWEVRGWEVEVNVVAR